MKNSPIEWTGDTWPIVNGCQRVSPGCGGKVGEGGCYAERLISTRLRHMPKYKGLAIFDERGPRWTGQSRLWLPDLDIPLRTKKPTTFFVANMGDLFYEGVSDEEIAAVIGVMAACPQHTFQCLTKRAERMRRWFEWEAKRSHGKRACTITAQSYLRGVVKDARLYDAEYGPWPLTNVHLGVSVEAQQYADARIPHLLATPAVVRFVSAEPLLGPVDLRRFLRLTPNGIGLDWAIVGSESGPGARPMDIAWARVVVDQCVEAGVPVFTKQIATPGHPKGGDPAFWPPGNWPREFPRARPS